MNTQTDLIAAMVYEPTGRPSERAVRFWSWTAVVSWVFFIALQLVWMMILNAWASPLHLSGIGLSVIAGVVHASVMPRWRYRVHRWEITDDAIFVRSGWFTQETRVAPIARLQTVDSHRGFIGRIYGLTSVRITTASSAGALTIHALDDAVAADVVARLTEIAQHTAGDAT